LSVALPFYLWRHGHDAVRVDEAATRIREEVDDDADIIVGAIFDEALQGNVKVSVVATGLPGVPRADRLTIVGAA